MDTPTTHLSTDELRSRYETLLQQVARFNNHHQALIETRSRLDRELERFAAIHRFNTAVLSAHNDTDLRERVAESVLEVFDTELGILALATPEHPSGFAPAAVAGLAPDELPPDWLSHLQPQLGDNLDAPRFLDTRAPELVAGPGLAQLVVAPCRGPDDKVLGLLFAGVTRANARHYARLEAADTGALTVLSQAVGTVLQRRLDRHLIEGQLRAIRIANGRLQQALEGGQMALWEWHLRTHRVTIFGEWEELLGHPPSHTPDHNSQWLSLIHPDDLPGLTAAARAARSGATDTFHSEHRVRRGDGSWVWYLARGRVIDTPGSETDRMVGVLVDISDRKAAEEAVRTAARAQANARSLAEQANQAKSAFLANMSHEIRTPMNGVLGILQLLHASSLAPDQRHLVETANQSARALLAIIDDLLDHAKIEAGRLRLEDTPYSPAEVLREVGSMFELQVQDRPVTLRLTGLDTLPPALRGDATRLRQVLSNLVGNALKFTARGHVHLSARYSRSTPGPHMLWIEVSDTGLGMDADQLARIFRPFEQADLSTTRRFGGTGLGLTICRHLVAMMGGTIQVESTLGEGSTFRFSIRAPQAPTPPKRTRTRSLQLPTLRTRAGAAPRVLVVEDNTVNQLVATRMLSQLGATVTCAEDGSEALLLLRNESFDIVLMDVHMPVLDGLETTRRIRGGTHTPRVPILALSASAMSDSRRACLDAGMDGFLEKPLQWSNLVDQLSRALGQVHGPPRESHS